ncbi:imidazolonepropionase [Lewinella sp. 4G2]|uniref:imidazolonepropionase n=1 Tax=Lewinella sp. 4G2 TaxID=1803372 RepID=UPI0007B4EF87|nr:imidazolonepropionase [Lewinella sp. 4G2]OAV44123.1 imidazolonepropionase [Lewinella sp. 4G2]
MQTLFTNIRQLLQIRPPGTTRVAGADMAELPLLENAWVLIEDDLIAGFGEMATCPTGVRFELDCTGQLMLPSWCDSHTHLVYAGNREGEWLDRLQGLSYAEIAAKGGGIVNSAALLGQLSEEDLYEQSRERLMTVIRQGTGAIEIKSGYGLDLEGELKMLRVIRRLREEFQFPVRATFLGAHALPPQYKEDKAEYVRQVCEEMLPQIAKEGLADYVDIFCEKGYFDVADTERLLTAGAKFGLRGKIHVNQFNAIGGVGAGVKHGALSVDHLEELEEEDVTALKGSDTMPVALPGCSFFLGIPYTPGRELIEAGLPLAVASDFNPGSCPSGNMNFVVALACSKMKLTPAEAINAATINGAYAMGLAEEVGSITVGKRANLILTNLLDSYVSLGYYFGGGLIDRVYVNGQYI